VPTPCISRQRVHLRKPNQVNAGRLDAVVVWLFINVFKLKDYKMIIKLLGKFIYLLYREVMTLKQKEADSRSPIKINREAFKRQTSS